MKNENGIEKSAILKGQTLVNVLNYSFKNNYSNVLAFNIRSLNNIKPLTSYLMYIIDETNKVVSFNISINNSNTIIEKTDGTKTKVTTNDFILNNQLLYIYPKDGIVFEDSDVNKIKIMLIEYQEGMENWDIPYFTGMQSVKLPVLTTTGKNLLPNIEMENGGLDAAGTPITDENRIRPIDFIPFSENVTYTKSNIEMIYFYDENKTSLDRSASNTYTSPIGTRYIKFRTSKDSVNMQIEQGTQATSYEPYKSNILTVNEDVELRGIGNVQDTLDLLTGEVTQRIGEVVLDGSDDEEWSRVSVAPWTTGSFIAFEIKLQSNGILDWNVNGKYTLNDKFKDITYDEGRNNGEGLFVYESGGKKICVRQTTIKTLEDWKLYLQQNPITVQYQLATESVKTVDITIQDQDNQPQERMKLFPTGYINTSSSTFPPILELKGITHNNKLNMTTTNGTNNTQLATLDNLALDGIICRDGTVVRDSYDVESGLYTKRVFRFTVDEEFVEKYRSSWQYVSNSICFELYVSQVITGLPKPINYTAGIANNMIYKSSENTNRVNISTSGAVYITMLKEELKSYDVDGLLDWVKRNGAIEIAYQMATPQIIHMQPNMQPYVSTRPYQGSIESQGNILESSFLDYTSEQSIISPKPLGDGDVLRWEQGSQCYVYENDKEYIPLTDYNQPMGTVLDLEEEDGEQFVENLDGGDIIVDVPFKEKAVYERHLVSHEDNVIYPTQDKLDPTGKIEVDYICGATWQNPNDLSDIRHVGTLREDGQYDVTIRRSGDDEIRLLDGITHIGLDGDGLNPSEFELTFFNSGGVEVGKYGDTSHTLEDCVLDSKLETGMVYGDTLVNIDVDRNNPTLYGATLENDIVTLTTNSGILYKHKNFKPNTTYTLIITITKTTSTPNDYIYVDGYGNYIPTETVEIPNSVGTHKVLFTTRETFSDTSIRLFKIGKANSLSSSSISFSNNFIILEGDYTSYPMDIPYFEGVGSTIVNGFTTVGKNLWSRDKDVELKTGALLNKPFNIKAGKYYFLGEPDITYKELTTLAFRNSKTNYTVAVYINSKNGVTLTQDCDDISIYSNGWSYPNSVDKPQTIKNFMLCKEYSTSYEPYHSMQYTLPTPITLNKIGDVVDTYDMVSGVETRNVAKIVLDGTWQWTSYTDDFTTTPNHVFIELSEGQISHPTGKTFGILSPTALSYCEDIWDKANYVNDNKITIGMSPGYDYKCQLYIPKSFLGETLSFDIVKQYLNNNPIELWYERKTPQTIQHTLIPSTVETMQEPTFILPQPLRSVPNGICDRLYWDENKGHYCIEKRIGVEVFDGVNNFNLDINNGNVRNRFGLPLSNILYISNLVLHHYTNSDIFPQTTYQDNYEGKQGLALYNNGNVYFIYSSSITNAQFKQLLVDNPVCVYYPVSNPEIIDLPHLNKKLTLPTQPDTLPIGYKVENTKSNPQLGLTIPYKQLNYPSRPQNIDFKMDIADYVLTWDDVKEARQYNVILNDRVIATVKEPQWNSGEEMYGYIMVEAQNELAENLSEELYIKTVPNAPAQLTVGHNPMTNYYDFEISFIKTSAIAEYYTVQYRIDGGEWVYKTIQSDEIDPNTKVLWSFSVYEINEQIEVWATATNEIGTNDILPIATYYMSPTPQWTYRINSKELFVRWMDDSPYDTQYKLRYQYKSDGIYRYAYFEGDKQEIGKLYEALIPLADDEEVSIALCIMSEKENLYTKPIKASKELDPNIKPPKNFNYHWLSRGLIEFYWEDNYDVDVEYEAIVEHRLTSGNNEWITDTRIFSATDTEGTGTVYRLSYQLEDLEEIRVKVRMKWAMNETEWSESLTTVFIPVEGNPPQWIRRTQTQEGLLVEWEAQEYVDSYHVYVMSNGEELQHLETMDNFIYVDLDYSNPIDIEIYEATRFSGGIQSDPTDKMCFRPTMDKQQLIHNVVTPDTLTYELEVDTIQKGIKERQVIHDINTTPNVTSKQPMDVAISSPFTLSFHPLQLDVHQSGAKYYGDTELHIKTLDVKSRDSIEVLTFERITDQYGVDFTVYTPSASKYPITLEVNRVRIVCFGDSLTSGGKYYQIGNMDNRLVG